MSTYSFLDVNATLVGPGGSVNLGASAAAAEEGITVEAMEDKNIMTIGAGGQGMHSLVANKASTVTIRLLRTSPTNNALQNMYNFQTGSSSRHGRNVIVITDLQRGDVITASGAAFKREPTLTYAKEGGMLEWSFDAISTVRVLGVGTPSIF